MNDTLRFPTGTSMAATLRRHLQLLLLGLFFLSFILFTILLGPTPPQQPYDLNSASPGGLLALRLWLEEMSYRVESGRPDDRTLWDGDQLRTHLLLIYPNLQPLDEAETDRIRAWVEAGGTLVLVGTEPIEDALVDTFGVYTLPRLGALVDEAQPQPLLPDAPARTRRLGLTDVLDLSDAPRAVPVLTLVGAAEGEETDREEADRDATEGENGDGGDAEEPRATVAVQALGAGWVWHLTLRYDLANGPLRDENVAQLLPALLRAVPDGGTVLVDTYHLYGEGIPAESEITSVWAWLQRTAPGRAISFAAVLTFLFLLIQGRRLGPPLPSITAEQPRAAAEYVTAMAGLQRRAHQRSAIARHHRVRLKTAVARTAHISPALDDDEFLARLQQATPIFTADEQEKIAQLLHAFQRDLNEEALVQTVAEVDALLQTRQKRR